MDVVIMGRRHPNQSKDRRFRTARDRDRGNHGRAAGIRSGIEAGGDAGGGIQG
jgi:hypothetical protein